MKHDDTPKRIVVQPFENYAVATEPNKQAFGKQLMLKANEKRCKMICKPKLFPLFQKRVRAQHTYQGGCSDEERKPIVLSNETRYEKRNAVFFVKFHVRCKHKIRLKNRRKIKRIQTIDYFFQKKDSDALIQKK